MTPTRLQEILSRAFPKRILVIGDLMLDEFVWGKVGRISPEAPVPVVEVTGESFYPGGAANVGRNLREFVRATGCGLFVVVLSSNPEGRALQNALVAPGLTLALHLCAEITTHNEQTCPEGTGLVGAVVGLTADGASDVAARLPRSLLLAPGLGAQGGTFEQAAERFAVARQRVLPSSSRGLLAHGPELPALQRAIREHCARAAEVLR